MTNKAIITYYDTYIGDIVLEVVYNVRLYDKSSIYRYLRANGYLNVHPSYKLKIEYI
jgi:hypothetical protein